MKKYSTVLVAVAVLVLIVVTDRSSGQPICNTSGPSSGSYTVTVCIGSPADGATISGDYPVTVTLTTSGSSPGAQRLVYDLSGEYLITDYQAPYEFELPSDKFVDGAKTLSVEAQMRDGFNADLTSVNLTFSNGVTEPPVNTNTFTPYTGSPTPGQPFVVAATGDGAGGRSEATAVTDLIVQRDPDVFLYLGDVYQTGTYTEFFNWYGTADRFFGRFRDITNPTAGNHEYDAGQAPGYFFYWDNVPDYYSFNTAGWRFINLNSSNSFDQFVPGTPQYEWLAQELTNTSHCTLTFYHEPRFSIGTRGDTARMDDIWALMAQEGVDVVLGAHDHAYQRWEPLDQNGNPDPQGMVQIIAGGGGQGIQNFVRNDPRMVVGFDTPPQAYGSLFMTLNPDGMAFAYVNIAGDTIDYGVVPCTGAPADTTIPDVPANLIATTNAGGQVLLEWEASSDNTGVDNYIISRDGTPIVTVNGATLSHVDTTVAANSTYAYTVEANDPAGNTSGPSNTATITTASSGILTLTPEDDAYVNQSLSTTNYGSATVLRTDASPDLHSFLRFNVPNLLGNVLNATLRIYPNSNSGTGYTVHNTNGDSWSENTITYDNAPGVTNELGASGAVVAGTWTEIDITASVVANSILDVALQTTSSTNSSYSSKEGSFPPELVITVGVPDTDPPTVPTGLSAPTVTESQVDLTWTPSTDNVAVAGYNIYRDGVYLDTVFGDTTTSYPDTTVAPETTYNYTVDAFDAASNTSAQSSPPLQVTTPPAPPDTAAPTIPANLRTNSVTYLAVDLEWDPSTDNVGVTGYRIFRDGGEIASVGGGTTTYHDMTVTPGATHNYTVEASDAVSNYSGQSSPPLAVNVPPAPSSFTFNPVADSYVSEGNPGSNYGSRTSLRIDGSPARNGYLRFDVQGLVGFIESATLRLYANGSGSAGYFIHGVSDNSWSELAITFDNAPPIGSVVGSHGPFAAGYTEVDVTSLITGNGIYSLAMTQSHPTAESFGSRESNNPPELVINTTAIAPDTDPPTVPTGLATSSVTHSQVDLTWTPSTDNVAVAGYNIYRDGVYLDTVLGDTTTYQDTAVTSDTTYSYTVSAFDAAGNTSAQSSPPLQVTTPPPPPDTTAPTVPTNLRTNNVTYLAVDLEWDPSTDNVGVAGYRIFRDGGEIASVGGGTTTYQDSNITPGATHNYTVEAHDAGPNYSGQSNPPLAVNVPAVPSSFTFNPVADSYVNPSQPSRNYGSRNSLRLDGSPILTSYLQFEVQGLAGTVASATLRVYANTTGSDGYSVHGVSNNGWLESAITFNNAPAIGGVVGSHGPFAAGYTEVDVTSLITGDGTFSLAMTQTHATAESFGSRESSNPPELVIDVAP